MNRVPLFVNEIEKYCSLILCFIANVASSIERTECYLLKKIRESIMFAHKIRKHYILGRLSIECFTPISLRIGPQGVYCPAKK